MNTQLADLVFLNILQMTQSFLLNNAALPSQFSIAKRLTLGFGAVIAIGVAIALIASIRLHHLANDLQVVNEQKMVQIKEFVHLKDNLNAAALNVRNMMIDPTQERRDRWNSALQKVQQENLQVLQQLASMPLSDTNQDTLASIKTLNETYDKVVSAAAAIAVTGDAAGADKVLFTGRETRLALFKAVEGAIDVEFKSADNLTQTGSSSAKVTSLGMFALAFAMGLVGVLVAWRLARQLYSQLGAEPGHLSASAQQFAQGNLAAQWPVLPGDECSTMAALQQARATLVDVVGSVRDNAESVATASAEIALGNADLSQRTEQQASALQQTSATMDELGTTVRNNADNAAQANQLALTASDVTMRGRQLMGEVITTMQDINNSSSKIADIIGVIDSIAFQTNILALNAAVEAARAGEQGRGFAVVASEVRALAQRSATAAKEIKTLINDSVERAGHGSELVQRTGSTMNDIASAIQRVSDIVGEISHASAEQSTGVAQIIQAVTQLDNVTQQNAALVEESAAAAASLKTQASQLVDAVAFFKIGPQNGLQHR